MDLTTQNNTIKGTKAIMRKSNTRARKKAHEYPRSPRAEKKAVAALIKRAAKRASEAFRI